jgi:hypothetical protein
VVAYIVPVWYKSLSLKGAKCKVEHIEPGTFGGLRTRLEMVRQAHHLEQGRRIVIMETTELKTAIAELSARIDKIRDWL